MFPIMQHLYCKEGENKISSSAKQSSKCRYKKRSSDIEYINIPEGLSMITSHDRNDLNSNRIKNYLSKFSLSKEPNPTKNEWGDWEKLLRSTYSEDGNPLSAMCIKTDMGFQTVSSSFIALPSSKSKLDINKPIFRYANGSPDCTSFKNLKL